MMKLLSQISPTGHGSNTVQRPWRISLATLVVATTACCAAACNTSSNQDAIEGSPSATDSSLSSESAPAPASATPAHDIDLAVISDFHGHIENAAAVDAAVAKIRRGNPETHLIAVGDNVGGSAYVSAVDDDNPTMDVLKKMGLEVTAVGNHEFDRGFLDLKERIQPRMGIKILAANITPQNSLPDYQIMDYNGIRVAYVGAVTSDMDQLVAPNAIAGLSFSDPSAAVNKAAARLKDGSPDNDEADVVVALIHEDADKVAPFLSDKVDVAFAGHSHIQKETRTPSGAPVCEPINYGTALVHATIDVDKGGKVATSCKPVEITDEQTPEIKKDYEAALERAKELGNKPVGYLDKDAKRGAQPDTQEPGSNRGTESPASNLIAEVFWKYGQKFPEKPDLGIMNPGGVRGDYTFEPNTSMFDTDEPGLITLGESNNVQPFGNSYAFKTFTGAQLYSVLEQQWQGEAAKHSMLRLGLSPNVTYTYTPSPRGGKHVQELYVDGKLVPNNGTKKYTVASNSFLLQGADGFSVLGGGSGYTDTGTIDNDAFNDYLSRFTANKPMKVTYSQRSVGLPNYPRKLRVGQKTPIELNSLSMTAGEPMPQKATIKLCHATTCVKASSTTFTMNPKNAGSDDAGSTTVTLSVPKDFPKGKAQLHLATDDGTEVPLPALEVTK